MSYCESQVVYNQEKTEPTSTLAQFMKGEWREEEGREEEGRREKKSQRLLFGEESFQSLIPGSEDERQACGYTNEILKWLAAKGTQASF